MQDPHFDELLSASFDGELTPDERSELERRLSESAECRQILEDYRKQRALLQALPRYQAPIDLADRILSRLSRELQAPLVASIADTKSTAGDSSEAPILASLVRSESPTEGRTGSSRAPVVAELAPTPQEVKRRNPTWIIAIGVVTALAASLLIAFGVRPPASTSVPPGVANAPRKSSDGSADVAKAPDPAGVNPPSSALPDEQLASVDVAEFQRRFTYVAVYDLVISPKGQELKVLEQSLKIAEIPLDQPIQIENRLERGILESRFVGEDKIATANNLRDVSKDEVEMIFVRGKAKQLDAVWRELSRIRQEQPDAIHLRMDLAVATKELEIFLNLNNALDRPAPSGIAKSESWSKPGVHRLQFRSPLHSVSLTRLGALSPGFNNNNNNNAPATLPVAKPQALQPLKAPLSPPIERSGQEVSKQKQVADAAARQPTGAAAGIDMRALGLDEDQASQMLLIVRNLQQGF